MKIVTKVLLEAFLHELVPLIFIRTQGGRHYIIPIFTDKTESKRG